MIPLFKTLNIALSFFSKALQRLLIMGLLLAVGSATCIAVQYKVSILKNTAIIPNGYKTIATLDTFEMKRFVGYDDYQMYTYDDSMAELITRIYAQTSLLPYAWLDRRESLLGIADDVRMVPDNSMTPHIAITATCVSSEWTYGYNGTYYNNMDYDGYIAMFRVDDVISAYKNYTVPEIVMVPHDTCTEDGQIPFVIGEQYLLVGQYLDVIEPENNPDVLPQILLDHTPGFFYENMVATSDSFPIIHSKIAIEGDIYTVRTMPDVTLALFCIPTNGNVHALLDGSPYWRDRIYAMQVYYHTVNILATDDLDSIMVFNQNNAWITQGRTITHEEFEQGALVCMIPKSFAIENGLAAGDTITVSLYEAPFLYTRNGTAISQNSYNDSLLTRGVLTLEIVGFYFSVNSSTMHDLTTNTIIIPTASIPVVMSRDYQEALALFEKRDPESNAYKDRWSRQIRSPALYAAVIDNDKLSDFRGYMESAGLSSFFDYRDQGYSRIKLLLENLERDTDFLLEAAILINLLLLPLLVFIIRRETLGTYNGSARKHIFSKWVKRIVLVFLISSITLSCISSSVNDAVLDTMLLPYIKIEPFGIDFIEMNRHRFTSPTDIGMIWIVMLAQCLLYLMVTTITGFILVKSRSKHPTLEGK